MVESEITLIVFSTSVFVVVVYGYLNNIDRRKLKNNYNDMTLEEVKKLIIKIRKKGQNIQESVQRDITRYFDLDIKEFMKEFDKTKEDENPIKKDLPRPTELVIEDLKGAGNNLIQAGESFKYILNTVFVNLCVQVLLWFIILKGRDNDIVEIAYVILIITGILSTIFVLLCLYNISQELIDSGKKLNNNRKY